MPYAQSVLTAGLILCLFHSMDFIIKKLRLQRKYVMTALLLLLAGTLVPTIELSNELWISPSGFIIPFFIVIILWAGAKEKIWSIGALVCNTISLYLLSKFVLLPGTTIFINRYYLIGTVCGILALLFGRYRNTVLISAFLSTQISGLLTTLEDWILGGYAMLRLGTQDELNAFISAVAIAVIGIYIRVIGRERRRKYAEKPQQHCESETILEEEQTAATET